MIIIARTTVLALLLAVATLAMGLPREGRAAPASAKLYVGTETCRSCHEDQYARYVKFSKKNHSFQSVRKLAKGLTDKEVQGCWQCHTTGYGRPGGFRSEAETPQLQNTGCEVCHGPGSVHAASQNRADIQAVPTLKECETCHNAERIQAFRFKPMMYAGAH